MAVVKDVALLLGPVTVKLRGRAMAPDWSRARMLYSRARGDTTALHGPSNDEMDSSWMAVRHRCAKLSLRSQLKPFQKESVNALYDRCC